MKPKTPENETDSDADGKEIDYGRLAGLSGLNEFEQTIPPEHPEREGRGYVRYVLFDNAAAGPKGDKKSETPGGGGERGETDEAAEDGGDGDAPEKKEIQALVEELHGRGWRWADMAVLAYRNDEVADAAAWLNEKNIEFISFSNLDIRRRKIIGEILSFLRFLDAPPDDLAFAEFLLGDLFTAIAGEKFDLAARREFLRDCYREKAGPCYTALHRRFPDLWRDYFEPFFKSVGYLPLYDLVTRMYRQFDVFALFPGEEAALTKLLEAIKNFEGEGQNDLRKFLEFSADEEDPDNAWTIDVPLGTDAVNIMSIHKAKGKTIPVVICLFYGQTFQGNDFYLQDAADGVHVFKITKKSAEADDLLGKIYGEARDREWVDKLNSLYVALTRAQYELYIVGVKGKRGKYPFDVLETVFDLPGRTPATGPAAARWTFERGKSAPRDSYFPPKDREKIGGDFGDGDAGLRQEVEHRAGYSEPGVEARESLNSAGVRRGVWIHRILAGIEYNRAGWPGEIAAVLDALGPAISEKRAAEEAGTALLRAFGKSVEEAWFEERPGRLVHREFDICDAGGNVFRMDRVVVDPESLLVVDFKTGSRSEFAEEYREQIRRYRGLLKDLYPGRPVRGVLSFLDQDRIEEGE